MYSVVPYKWNIRKIPNVVCNGKAVLWYYNTCILEFKYTYIDNNRKYDNSF